VFFALTNNVTTFSVINKYEDSLTAFRVIVFTTVGGAIFFVAFILMVIRRMGALPNLF
jgi:hypothetical protein